jgi:hypothetical protein
MAQTTTTSKDIGTELMEIAPKVDSPILNRTCLEFGVHYGTIYRYLKGVVPESKKIFATKLLNYLKEQTSA